MKISLKQIMDNYYFEYQKFYSESLVNNINNKILISTNNNLIYKPIKLNYIWRDYGKELMISCIIYNKYDDIVYRGSILLKKEIDRISLYSNPSKEVFKDNILNVIEEKKEEIFNLLLKYKDINISKLNERIIINENDYLTMNRTNNYISFILHRKDKKDNEHIKASREFGMFLDNGILFVSKNKEIVVNNVLHGHITEEYIDTLSNSIIIDTALLKNESLIITNNYKKRRRVKNEKV